MNMPRILSCLTTAIAVISAPTLTAPIAFAQDSASPPSRAQVKAETRAAEAAGKLIPAGEGLRPAEPPGPKSTRTRAERKAETRKARKDGKLLPAGDSAKGNVEEESASNKSTKTRAERKAETRSAAKAHQLIPAGEGPGASRR